MSFLFARTLSSFSISRGSRSDIDLTGASTPGSNSISTRPCFEKSKYSVVSRLFQNSRSSLSDLNLGTFLIFFFIAFSLAPAHWSRTNHANALVPQRENNRQESTAKSLSHGCVPNFISACSTTAYQYGLVKKDLFCLSISYSVLPFVLARVSGIPFKSEYTSQDFVHVYINIIYAPATRVYLLN